MGTDHKIFFSKLKHIVFMFFILLLFMPMIQQLFGVIKENKLEQVENSAPFPTIAIEMILESSFQKEFESALNINIGFRKTFVRIHNQLNYSVYNVSKAGGVVIGKNGFVFIDSYINAYSGKDFRGKESIELQIQKALVVQSELKKRNIELVFAFAPGKGSFYPEYIPDDYLKNINHDSTNYSCFVKAINKTNLNFIDIKKYFLSIKDTAKNLLFPIPGVHWTEYGSVLAIDTISNYFSTVLNIKTPGINISGFKKKDLIKYGDYDAANLMNIFTTIPHEELPYIDVNYIKQSEGSRPKLLCIADSYFSTIEHVNIPDSLFSDCTYWLYERREPQDKKGALEFQKEIENKNVVLLLGTDATLASFPYRFIDEAYEVYSPKNKSYFELKNREFRQFITEGFKNIEKNKKWKRQLNKSAKEKKISVIDEYIAVLIWLFGEQEIKNKKFTIK